MTIYPTKTIAVIFSAKRNGNDAAGYDEAAEQMVALAKQQKGFLGMNSVRDMQGYGITISYWQTDSDARAWRDHTQHSQIRHKGRALWYDEYSIQIARIDRAYDWHYNE